VTRTAWVAPAPADIAALWPQARQVAAVHSHSEPRRPQAKPRKDELHFYLVAGPAGSRRLSPKRLAKLIRNHWGIENRLHHVKDRTFREDEQRVWAGQGAMVMTWLRTVALGLLYNAKGAGLAHKYIPEKRQILNAKWKRAIRMLTSGAQ
jgi:hypothetical protein